MPESWSDDVFCAGCRRLIDKYRSSRHPGDRVVEIRIGKLLQDKAAVGKKKSGRPRSKSDKFRVDSVWGVMHIKCFVRSLESPDDVFAELSIHNVS